jgi:hypothetical protein
MYRVTYVLAFILFISCSSLDDSTPHAFRIYEERGVTITETTGGPKYVEELFQFEKIVELRFDPENTLALMTM